MKNIGLFLSILLLNCTHATEVEKEDVKYISIYLIGDSTMASKSGKLYPETGWGQMLGQYLDTLLVSIDNRAADGCSTKSFIAEKRWSSVMDKIEGGDYVLIQFGHNDEKTSIPDVGTTIAEFKNNLSRFITEAEQKGAVPVLLTPIARRSFVNGKYVETHGKYPEAVSEVAREQNVALIDMHAKSISLLETLGDENSKTLFNWATPGEYPNYPGGVQDNTHFNTKGASEMAELVAGEIKQLGLPLIKYLRTK